jgi:hypothetical protein
LSRFLARKIPNPFLIMLNVVAQIGSTNQAAERSITATNRVVRVCMDQKKVAPGLGSAQASTSETFAKIGITLVWMNGGKGCQGSKSDVVVSLIHETPEDMLPNSWAYALPFERTHIVVFYDRLMKTVGLAALQPVLGYVLAHEIAHILQGLSRHSDTGIMKPHWDRGDYQQILHHRLEFAEEDVRLIYDGLPRFGSSSGRTP